MTYVYGTDVNPGVKLSLLFGGIAFPSMIRRDRNHKKPYLFGLYVCLSSSFISLSHAATLSVDKVARQSCAIKSQV